MKRERDLLFLDCETSGVDPMTDRIVELGIIRLDPRGDVTDRMNCRYNPQRPIPAEATAVHGITDADVAACPTFEGMAPAVVRMFENADYVGYNLRRLDLPILDEEFRRCGLRLPLDGVRIIDCYGIWAKLFPRKLTDAVRFFCGRELEDAHGALADALATMAVFEQQTSERFPEAANKTMAELEAFCQMADEPLADLAGKLYRDKDGDLRYAFGKAKDVKVRDDLGYARWMLTKASFPGNTNEVLEAELDRLERQSGGLFPDQPFE